MQEAIEFLKGKKTHILVAIVAAITAYLGVADGSMSLEDARSVVEVGLLSTVKAAADRWFASS